MENEMIYVVGHRGAAGVKPENTLMGFRYAIDLGVEFVECDVHLTRDEQLVVVHDPRVDRTTNATGAIRDLDFEFIRSLDVGEGQRIPTLSEVLETVQDKVKLLCELKGEGVEDLSVDTVVKMGMAQDVIFTSFNIDRIRRVLQKNEDLQTGAIFSNPTDDDIKMAGEMGVCGVGVHYKNLRLKTVEQALEAELDIRAWNPDTLREQQAMIALGVSGVGTNRPDILMEYLKLT
jgi:glycerophosphoryl diester phosphodiesterase